MVKGLLKSKRYKSEVLRTPTFDFGDHHTSQLILHSFIVKKKKNFFFLPRERIELPYLYLQNSALTTKQPRLILFFLGLIKGNAYLVADYYKKEISLKNLKP
jgi:hypothetical protein